MRTNRYHISALFLIFLIPASLPAQTNTDYILADRLMQQQDYESALPILKELNKEFPYDYIYFERLTECFVQLKQYDEALETAQSLPSDIGFQASANVLIAKLYHFKEDTARAYALWKQNLEEHPGQFQVYINTARAMSARGLHQRAVEVYKQGRMAFQNDQLFINDIANELMQAGKYEEAIREWLRLIELRPEQLTFVQRLLLRFNDPLVNDITIMELEDKLNELPINSPSYSNLYQLQIWLLQENKLYRRALVTARAYENSTSTFNYSLFSLGRKLVENKEFELAKEAFSYYIERGSGEIKWRNMEELALTYSKWAKHLDDNNLDFNDQADSLYEEATRTLNTLIRDGATYSRLGRALTLKADIELDHTYDLEAAKQARNRLTRLSGYGESAELAYLDGRIYLAEREFTQARIAFTKSNKRADIGELAEKSRYFLALTDFYTGDYEFAKIQLKSLGRQNTSYYANDALQLRIWLQEALASDTTGQILEPFAEAYFQSFTGNHEEANERYLAMLDDPELSVLHDDIYVQLMSSENMDPSTTFAKVANYLNEQGNAISEREKLMWQRAWLAELILDPAAEEGPSVEDRFFRGENYPRVTREKVIEYYEELILEYPQGFYAESARERIKELSKVNI